MTQLVAALTKALSELAYAPKRGDWRNAVRDLCRSASASEANYFVRCPTIGGELLRAHVEAKRLLDLASRVGKEFRQATRDVRNEVRKEKEAVARRRLLERADLEYGDESDLPFSTPFVVRQVMDTEGSATLEVLGPKNPTGRFLVAYLFWKVAGSVPVETWIRFLPRPCPVCGKTFHERRYARRGGEMTRCYECLARDRRAKKRHPTTETLSERKRRSSALAGSASGFRRIKKKEASV